MSQWICEDVGLVINELRDKFSEKLNELDVKEGEPTDERIDNVLKGINICYDILDEVADNWTCENPPEEVLNKIKSHYEGLNR